MRAHGLAAPSDRVLPPAPTIGGETTTVFRSCASPAPYASAGFTEIRVTRVPWPAKAEFTNASAPDRITAPCAEVELRYVFAKQGPPELQAPVRFSRGARMYVGGQPVADALPFPVTPDDIVVVHNLSYTIDSARCIR